MPIWLAAIISMLVFISFAAINGGTFVPGWLVVVLILLVATIAVFSFTKGGKSDE